MLDLSRMKLTYENCFQVEQKIYDSWTLIVTTWTLNIIRRSFGSEAWHLHRNHFKPPIFLIQTSIYIDFESERAVLSLLQQCFQKNQPKPIEVHIFMKTVFSLSFQALLVYIWWTRNQNSFVGSSVRLPDAFWIMYGNLFQINFSSMLSPPIAWIDSFSLDFPKQELCGLVSDQEWRIIRFVPYIQLQMDQEK